MASSDRGDMWFISYILYCCCGCHCGEGDTSELCIYCYVSSLRKKKVCTYHMLSSYIVCFHLSIDHILKTLLTSIFLALNLNSILYTPTQHINQHKHIFTDNPPPTHPLHLPYQTHSITYKYQEMSNV